MSPIPATFLERFLVFDTGPLWELILYSAVRDLRFESLRPNLHHIKNDAAFQRLTEFVASYPRRTTTAHVIAEISSHIMRTDRAGQSEIWGIVYREFSSMGMDEHLLKLLEMPQELVAEIGAVDTSVLNLGKKFGHRNSVVLSIDSTLVKECKHAGVDAKHLTEVTDEWY
jgi:hypothetical protein